MKHGSMAPSARPTGRAGHQGLSETSSDSGDTAPWRDPPFRGDTGQPPPQNLPQAKHHPLAGRTGRMVESERPNGADWLRDGPRSGSMANRLLPPRVLVVQSAPDPCWQAVEGILHLPWKGSVDCRLDRPEKRVSCYLILCGSGHFWSSVGLCTASRRPWRLERRLIAESRPDDRPPSADACGPRQTLQGNLAHLSRQRQSFFSLSLPFNVRPRLGTTLLSGLHEQPASLSFCGTAAVLWLVH